MLKNQIFFFPLRFKYLIVKEMMYDFGDDINPLDETN